MVSGRTQALACPRVLTVQRSACGTYAGTGRGHTMIWPKPDADTKTLVPALTADGKPLVTLILYLTSGLQPAAMSHTTAVTSTETVTRNCPVLVTSMSVTRAAWARSGGTLGSACPETMVGFRSNMHTDRSHDEENRVLAPAALPQHTADTQLSCTSSALQCVEREYDEPLLRTLHTLSEWSLLHDARYDRASPAAAGLKRRPMMWPLWASTRVSGRTVGMADSGRSAVHAGYAASSFHSRMV